MQKRIIDLDLIIKIKLKLQNKFLLFLIKKANHCILRFQRIQIFMMKKLLKCWVNFITSLTKNRKKL